MRKRNSLVRRQLLLLLLALFVPYLVFLSITTARQSTSDRESAGRRMLGVARLTSARLDDHINEMQQLLSVLGVLVGTASGDTERNDALFQSLVNQLPEQVQNLNVWAADGTNIGTLKPQIRAAGLVVKKHKFFVDAEAHKASFAVEAPVVSVLNGKMIGVFALRLEREGRFAGVVAVTAHLQHLQSLLSQKGMLPEGSVVTILNPDGTVLARSIDPDKWVGKASLVRGSQVADFGVKQEGVHDGASADGVDRVGGFIAANRVPW